MICFWGNVEWVDGGTNGCWTWSWAIELFPVLIISDGVIWTHFGYFGTKLWPNHLEDIWDPSSLRVNRAGRGWRAGWVHAGERRLMLLAGQEVLTLVAVHGGEDVPAVLAWYQHDVSCWGWISFFPLSRRCKECNWKGYAVILRWVVMHSISTSKTTWLDLICKKCSLAFALCFAFSFGGP